MALGAVLGIVLGAVLGIVRAVVVAFVLRLLLTLAVIGDIAPYVEASGALRDYVWESTRGSQVWFLADRAELEARLGARAG